MTKTKGERREEKRNKNRKMKVSGRGLNQTQQRIVEMSANYICNKRWTSKDNHGTGHICTLSPNHTDNHQCSVCGIQRR